MPREDKEISRPLRIEKLIEPDRLLQILEKYVKPEKALYRLMDIDGNWIGEPPDREGFCQIMQSTPTGRDFCLESNRPHLKEAAESDEPIIHACAAGVVDSIAAIRVAGDVIGYVHGMAMVLAPPSAAQSERVVELASRLNITDKKEALEAAIQKTPVMSKDRALEMTKGLTQVATELTRLSLYARQASIFKKTHKRLANFSSKDDIRAAILDGVEALIGEVNICIFELEGDGCLRFFGSRCDSRDLESLVVKVGEGHIGWAARHGRSLLVHDLNDDAEVSMLEEELKTDPPPKSALTLPILSKDDQTLAVLQVVSPAANTFSEADVSLLEVFADNAGMALEKFRLESGERKLPSLGLDKMLKRYLQNGLRILNSSSANIGLLDEDGQTLEIRTAVGSLERHLPLRVDSTVGITGRVIRNGACEVVNDVSQDADYGEMLKAYAGTPYGSFQRTIGSTVKAPLRVGEKIVGVVCVHWDAPNAIPPNVEDVVEFLAEGIGDIVETVRAQKRFSWEDMILGLVGRNIKTGLDLAAARRELFEGLAYEALRITSAMISNVRLYEENDETLRFVAFAGDGWTKKIREHIYSLDDNSAAAYVVKHCRPRLIHNTKQEVEHYKEVFPDVRSHISVPIFFRKAIAGVLSVDSNREYSLSPADVSSLNVLATHCSMMLDHFAMIEESWLYDLEKFLSETSDLEVLLKGVVGERIPRLFGVEGCTIFLLNQSNSELRAVATTGLREQPTRELRVAAASGIDQAGKDITYEIGEGLTGWIAKHKRTLRLRDTADKEELARVAGDGIVWAHKLNEDVNYNEVQGHFRFLGTPLMVRNEVIGVLRMTIKTDKSYFTYNDELLLESLASRLALFIQNILLTEERNRRATQFTELGNNLAETLDLKKVAQIILKEGLKIVGCDAGHIRIFDKKRGNLKLLYATGPHTKKLPKFRERGEGISGKVANDFVPLIIPDVKEDEKYLQVLEEDFGQPQQKFLKWVKSETCHPLIVQDELIGTLNMHWRETRNFDKDDVLKLVDDLANRSAIALKAALMYGEIENELKKSIKAQQRLRLIGMEFAQTLNLDELLGRLLEHALDASRLNSGVIRILDAQRNKWVLKAARGDTQEPLKEKLISELEYKDDILMRAAKAETATIIEDTREDGRFQQFVREYPDAAAKEFLHSFRSAVLLPIRLKRRCLGLVLLNSKELYQPPESTIQYLELLTGQAAIAIDIAQLYERQDEALQITLPLGMLGSMMGSFLHESRNPLQRLTGSLDVVQHRNFDQTELPTYLREMRDQVDDLADILNEFALFARTDSTALKESMELDSAIEKVIRESSYSFGTKINCTTRLNVPDPVIRGNRAQVERAFKLIIGNAVDAMPAGGELLIETSYGIEPDEILVRFADTGVGMDEQTKEKCLEPRFTTKKEGRGTGLGLSVVYMIVTHHKGKIAIESAPGQGTTITLAFRQWRN
jgi:GAF domain-containing protein/ligand-binding sensor protein/two-component sensor histidine kinase